MLDQITPIILTFDEEQNIGRCLEKLTWAKRVIVVDSGSTDGTEEIARSFHNVAFCVNPFESHEAQWTWAVSRSEIETDWVLTLDADYILTEDLVAEMRGLSPALTIDGYRTAFRYAIHGRALRGSFYPPRIVLLRRGRFDIYQDGHTQRVRVSGDTAQLRSPVIHDDRKPIDRWLRDQIRYARLEADRLTAEAPPDNSSSRVRRLRVVAPFVVAPYLLLAKGLVLQGRAGFFYVFQRTVFELILSLRLLELDLRSDLSAGSRSP